MQTVVLAAGEGTRMRPLTDRRPKPALPVGDRPLVAHTLDAAVQAGATKFVLVVGYEADAIRERIGDNYAGVPVEYAVQSDQLGTADAVSAALDKLDDGPFAVVNGDALYDPSSLSDLFDNRPSVATYRVDEPSEYGVLEVENGADRVTGVVEKPSTTMIGSVFVIRVALRFGDRGGVRWRRGFQGGDDESNGASLAQIVPGSSGANAQHREARQNESNPESSTVQGTQQRRRKGIRDHGDDERDARHPDWCIADS